MSKPEFLNLRSASLIEISTSAHESALRSLGQLGINEELNQYKPVHLGAYDPTKDKMVDSYVPRHAQATEPKLLAAPETNLPTITHIPPENIDVQGDPFGDIFGNFSRFEGPDKSL